MSNVFILCAGRSASTALASALKPISNFTVAHESRCALLSTEKLNYPTNHIEIDNRLIWFAELLDEKYGTNAKFIYLYRDLDKIAKSYNERWHLKVSIVRAYGHGLLMHEKISPKARIDICRDYAGLVDTKIRRFIANKDNLIIDCDNLENELEDLVKFIDADVDVVKCKDILKQRHNLNQTNWLVKFLRKTLGAVRA